MELAVVGLMLGILLVHGALMLHIKPVNKKARGIMIIVLSVPSVVMGVGFIVGFILGIIGGKLALSRKTKM
jgi:ABC-type phosphate/phosphonate transport system permease subunit